jgi:murein DD-endopeptidase MepM/ murein hydrolase activator NlpD
VTIEHGPGGAVAALRYEIDDASTLVVECTGDVLTARRDTKPFLVEIRGVAGTVERGLWRDLVDAGAPPAVASSLTEIFGGEVDFRRVARGDEFRVLYEMATGAESGVEMPGEVLGAELRLGRRLVTAIRFVDGAGRELYYAPDGDALGRLMLRYPLEYTRISSGFTHRRLHPILGRHRPHLGVDFAAPRGTPVRATADGSVMMAGWKRDMGKMVRLRHERGLESLYGHLHRIAPGLRSGTRVRQGQVIGYVGSTGLATGDHLHYAVRHGGRFLNPLDVGSVRAAALSGSELPAFAEVRDAVRQELDRLGNEANPQVLSFAPPTGAEG